MITDSTMYKDPLHLIYEASIAQQRALMKEIQRRKEANEPALTPAEREALLNDKSSERNVNRFIYRGYFIPRGATQNQTNYINPKNIGHYTQGTMIDIDLNSNEKINEFLLNHLVPEIIDDMNIISRSAMLCSELKWNYDYLQKVELNPSDYVVLYTSPLEPSQIADEDGWNAFTPLKEFPKNGIYFMIIRRMYDALFEYQGAMVPQTGHILAAVKSLIGMGDFPMPYAHSSRSIDQLGIRH